MSVLRAIVDKLTSPGGSPVVRLRGFRRSKRTLITFFPSAERPQMTMIGVQELNNCRIVGVEDAGVFRLRVQPLHGYGTGEGNEIATFTTRSDLDEAMRKITKVLSLNPWRWFWRILILVLILSWKPPVGPVRGPVRAQAPLPPAAAMPSTAAATATPHLPTVTPPAAPIAAPQVPGAPAVTDRDDPFGMRTSPASSALAK